MAGIWLLNIGVYKSLCIAILTQHAKKSGLKCRLIHPCVCIYIYIHGGVVYGGGGGGGYGAGSGSLGSTI